MWRVGFRWILVGNDRKEHEMATTLSDAYVGDLSDRITGTVLRPHDSGYDEARAIHNGLIDRKPALIVRCRTADDVVAALRSRGAWSSRSRSAAAATASPVAP